MNRKQFIILLALVIIVGAAGLVVRQRGRESWQTAGSSLGQKLLPGLSVNDVAQITIKSGTNELNLARRDDLWRVLERGGYPANFQQISDLLLKFADLKIIQSDEVGPAQLGRFNLLPPGPDTNSGTLVELADANDKPLAALLLGKQHMKQAGGMDNESWPDGRYVMVKGRSNVDLISDALDSADPKPENWLNKDFFSIQKPGSVSVQFPEATNSWKLVRATETNEWQLADAKPGEHLDDSKISGVTTPFSSPSFNDVLAGDTSPAAAGLTNATVVTVKTFDGFSYTARIGEKRDDNYPMMISVAADLPTQRPAGKDEKPADQAKLDKAFKDAQKVLADKLAREKTFEHWIYQVPEYTVDPILEVRSKLLVESQTNSVTSSKSP